MPKKQTTKRSTPVKTRLKRHAKLALVPHKANQYRPHLIRRYGLVGILLAVIVGQFAYSGIMTGSVLGAQSDVTPAALLAATNHVRELDHEAPLTLNPNLTQAATLKIQNMFDGQYWAHDAPDGTTPWHWFEVVGYNYSAAGENLAKNFNTADGTVDAWMASTDHRANILKREYSDVGFATMHGTLDGKPTTLTVALYGAPDSAAVQGATATTDAPAIQTSSSLMTRFGRGLQSLTPAAVASIVLLIIAANVALLAHAYRKQLPLKLRRSWYRHHGLYKAVGLTSIALVVVFAYSGVGQV